MTVEKITPAQEVFTDEIVQFIRSYGFLARHHVLPEPGGLNQQPATWVDAATTLMELMAEREAEDDDVRARDMARRQREAQRAQGRAKR